MDKNALVRAMQWDHPTRTLDIGTISANASRTLKRWERDEDDPSASTLLSDIKTALRDITRLSSKVKRCAQRVIGLYIEQLAVHNIDTNEERNSYTTITNVNNIETNDANTNSSEKTSNITNDAKTINIKTLSDTDRKLLDILCPPFSGKDLTDIDKNDADQEPDNPEEIDECDDSLDGKDPTLSFLNVLLTAMHSAKLPQKKGMGLHVRNFIERAQEFLPNFTEGKSTEKYAGSSFLRSAAQQLSVELKRHYKKGTIDLLNKIKAFKSKKILPPETRDIIDPRKSTIENFVLLNKACGGRRSLMPVSPFEVKFITLSELELTRIFWASPSLKHILQKLAHVDFPSIKYWELLRRRTEEAQGLLGSTFLMTFDETRSHLQNIRNDSFEPASYSERGYVMRGSIRTDGFRLQVLAFKLNELHSVKYRRLPEEKLPSRLLSTVGGTDYFLTEVRNVVSTKNDVAQLWN
ncbi:hypothetical protein FBU30_002496, partial [Linnemannia zychae]